MVVTAYNKDIDNADFVLMTQQTVNLPQAIFAKLQVLPPAQQQEILDFAEFLIQKYERSNVPIKRVPDLHKGKIWMSDDFDEPLPDEFWLGENDPLLEEAQHSQEK